MGGVVLQQFVCFYERYVVDNIFMEENSQGWAVTRNKQTKVFCLGFTSRIRTQILNLIVFIYM